MCKSALDGDGIITLGWLSYESTKVYFLRLVGNCVYLFFYHDVDMKPYPTDAQFKGFLYKYRNAVPSVQYNLYRWFTNKYLLTDKQKREL